MSRLHLRPDEKLCRARDVRAGPRFAPSCGVRAVTRCSLHQAVPTWVEGDFVDAVAETVVGVQFRGMFVGVESPSDRLRGSRKLAQHLDLRTIAGRVFPRERFDQRAVAAEDVVAAERRRLIGNGVRLSHARHSVARERSSSLREWSVAARPSASNAIPANAR